MSGTKDRPLITTCSMFQCAWSLPKGTTNGLNQNLSIDSDVIDIDFP